MTEPVSIGAASEPRAGGDASVVMRVSNELVKIYKEQFGRGPTSARTGFAGPDTLVCTLQETFTPVERKLRQLEEHVRLRDMRMFLQYAAQADFCGAVERITGRTVVSFISGIDTRTGVAAEVFCLEPVGGGERPAAIASAPG